MSQWKVSKERIEIFTHPNADSLLIGKVGSYQVVVQKGLYNDGDEIIFAPEKSVLIGNIKTEFEKYLAGPDKNRVNFTNQLCRDWWFVLNYAKSFRDIYSYFKRIKVWDKMFRYN